jgi:hypothetical protein
LFFERITRREWVKSKVFKTESRGWGLKSVDAVSAGELIIEYIGGTEHEHKHNNTAIAVQMCEQL